MEMFLLMHITMIDIDNSVTVEKKGGPLKVHGRVERSFRARSRSAGMPISIKYPSVRRP
jgi:hypothetical protein